MVLVSFTTRKLNLNKQTKHLWTAGLVTQTTCTPCSYNWCVCVCASVCPQ